jgi:hypothetical protein
VSAFSLAFENNNASVCGLVRCITRWGVRESGTEHLKMAAETYRDALSVLSKDKNPDQYQETFDNLNQTLEALRSRGWYG